MVFKWMIVGSGSVILNLTLQERLPAWQPFCNYTFILRVCLCRVLNAFGRFEAWSLE